MTKWLDTSELRKKFLDYFSKRDHRIVESSPLVPGNDPTLLFTNAGMVQFKDVFLGLDPRSYQRAASSQRCVRAGGKHNDLENVGYTKRHHTFFEMLGNFSFGDYFKREAIEYAWRFLTEVLEIPAEKLWITVYRDDDESEDIWLKEIKVDPKRFSRCGEKDNFWSMGDTGPCGPCTEIFYDHGPEIEGGPPGSAKQDGDRYVEIWNLVFMQYNRDVAGQLTPLPRQSVDTGMGLERIASVTQGVHDNYDIDLFQHLLQALSEIIGNNDFHDTSMRVIVDHIRSTVFLVVDGVMPSNEGRGYVLRRIIRRAVRHGYKLGRHKPFFYLMVPALVEIMGEAYPELKSQQDYVAQIIEQEERQFSQTLSKGLRIFEQHTENLEGDLIPGHLVFQLYDTYGFPPDLTADIARERGMLLDYDGFEIAMQRQREMSQHAHKFNIDQTAYLHIVGETEFTGYDSLVDEGTVTTLLSDNKPVTKLVEGERGMVVLDRTPFYAESGGQVGDKGYLYFDTGQFRVQDTQSHGKVVLHIGEVVSGRLKADMHVRCEVNASRKDTILNHSATHLLHEALRRVLGEHVNQKGSLVEPTRLRFDFSHSKPLTKDELQAVERLVNQQIRANHSSEVSSGSLEEAKEKGALALFGEKYGEEVRVVKMGDFSTEVCGGTHVHSSGEIGFFKIISEAACAAGVRRIEALTGNEALRWVEHGEEQLQEMASLLKINRDELSERIAQLLEQNKSMSKELNKLRQQATRQQSDSIVQQAIAVNGVNVLAAELKNADRDTLRNTLDKLKQKMEPAAIVLASVQDAKVQLVAGLSKSCLDHFNATELLNQVAHQIGGKGGGRPDLAQGGGDNPAALAKALASVVDWVQQKTA